MKKGDITKNPCEITDKFTSLLLKTGIIEQIMNQAKFRDNQKLAKNLKGGKKSSRLLGIEKLEDANWAGTK